MRVLVKLGMGRALAVLLFIVSVGFAFYGGWHVGTGEQANIVGNALRASRQRPLTKYRIESLRAADIPNGRMEIDEENQLFSYFFDPTFEGGEEKRMSGQIMIPEGEGEFPLVLMIRGFVSQKIYETGTGSRRVAEELAKNGFITVAPDFFGFGESSAESENVFETRFQTYTTVLSLLDIFEDSGSARDVLDKWDGENVFIWGHSNGGQIALSVLTVNQRPIPTVLWAPVSKPFPYSILYYTDEAADGGKFLRLKLAEFEADYDVREFSFDGFTGDIHAEFQIHQGGLDDAIPVDWTDDLVENLREKDINVEYFTYPKADHNLVPNWDEAVARTIEFYRSRLN